MQYIYCLHRLRPTAGDPMSNRRPKLKTATMTIRLSPQVKAAAEAAARQDHRSIANLIEVLIMNHCQSVGLPMAIKDKDARP